MQFPNMEEIVVTFKLGMRVCCNGRYGTIVNVGTQRRYGMFLVMFDIRCALPIWVCGHIMRVV